MSVRPTLALVSMAGQSARSVALLSVLGRDVDVVSWRRRGQVKPDAIIATSVEALDEVREVDVPLGVWVGHHEELDHALAGKVDVILTARSELVARGAVLVPGAGIEVDRWLPASPLVRSRRREARGIEGAYIYEADDHEVGDETAMAMASVVVVSGPMTRIALALGAPTVTSEQTARRLRARPGRDVEVAPSPVEAAALAMEIALDDQRAAGLSRRGRRCAEHHMDLGRPARVIAQRLALTPTGVEPSEIAERLDELRTSPNAMIRRRIDDGLAALRADR